MLRKVVSSNAEVVSDSSRRTMTKSEKEVVFLPPIDLKKNKSGVSAFSINSSVVKEETKRKDDAEMNGITDLEKINVEAASPNSWRGAL